MTINQIRLAIALFGAAVISAGSAWSGYWIRDKTATIAMQARELELNRAVTVASQMQLDAVTQQAERNQQAEVIHDKNQRIIADIANSDRVRITIPASDCAVSEVTLNADSNPSSGVASARVEAELDRLQREIEQIGQSCAQLNIDAIRMNGQVMQ